MSKQIQQQRTLILDLGDVLFHWSSRDFTALSPQTFHAVISSQPWSELERGRITEDEAISLISAELSLKPCKIVEALVQCRNSLRVDHKLVAQLKELKTELDGRLKVYAMSNITKDDFARLKVLLPDWGLFDGDFPSFQAGMNKSERSFFAHVINSIGLSNPSSAVYVDDKLANVTQARSFGIQGIVFKSPATLMRELRNQLLDPVARARQYMATSNQKNTSYIEGGPEFRDYFSQFLIHYELNDKSLISLSPADVPAAEIKDTIEQAGREAKTWNYFISKPVVTTEDCKQFTPPPRSICFFQWGSILTISLFLQSQMTSTPHLLTCSLSPHQQPQPTSFSTVSLRTDTLKKTLP